MEIILTKMILRIIEKEYRLSAMLIKMLRHVFNQVHFKYTTLMEI
mgnify:FL=1